MLAEAAASLLALLFCVDETAVLGLNFSNEVYLVQF